MLRSIACGFAYTGPEGAWSEKQCREANACPAGSEYVGNSGTAFSIKDCVCKVGHVLHVAWHRLAWAAWQQVDLESVGFRWAQKQYMLCLMCLRSAPCQVCALNP